MVVDNYSNSVRDPNTIHKTICRLVSDITY